MRKESGLDANIRDTENKEKIKRAIIISGFPGVGKTTLWNRKEKLKVMDSDSTDFSWANTEKTIRNPNWPQNYIEHILEKSEDADLILVSSHDTVRDALVRAGIKFVLVYPSLEMKDEYIQRYKDRGSNEKFVNLLQENYEKWITELMSQTGCKHVVLQPGQYLSDVIDQIEQY